MENISDQRKVELRNTFQAAKTSNEMLKLFAEMESCFEEADLGLECLALTSQLFKDKLLEQVLHFGNKALTILLKNRSMNAPFFGIEHKCEEHASSLSTPFALQMLGNACLDLKRFDDSLKYLNWASRLLTKIELDKNSSCGGKCILNYSLMVEDKLSRVKWNLGMKDEVVDNLEKIVEIKGKIMEKGCIEIGEAYKNLFGGYVMLKNFRNALPCCLKALEIYEKYFGRDSVEAAQITGDLAAIYYSLGDCNTGIELRKMSKFLLNKTASYPTDMLESELGEGKSLIEMGSYEEAVTVLRGVVSHTPINGVERAKALLYLARAFCELGNFADARMYMKTACKNFEQKELSSLFITTAYENMSRLYEKMDDREMAISMLKKALTLPDFPPEVLAECAKRLFSLVSSTEKEKELIKCLEDVVEKLKKDLDPNHSEVGYNSARLGFAYMKLGQEELAVTLMTNAKDIMDVSLGPHHLDSLKTSQMLSVTYSTMKRYRLAMQLQEQVIEGLKGLGSSDQEFMDEAVRLLTNLKEKVKEESPTTASFQSKDGKDLSTKISKCSISDVGGN